MHNTGRAARGVNLQTKVVGFLLAISMVPLVVAFVLINQSAQVALNFASNEVAFLRPPLNDAKSVYLELIKAKRDLYYPQVALRIAALPAIVSLATGAAGEVEGDAVSKGESDALAALDALIAETHELGRVDIMGQNGQTVVSRRSLAGVTATQWRDVPATAPIAGTGATLVLTFAADSDLQANYAALSRAVEDAKRIDEMRSALPSSYRTAFLLLVGAMVLVVSVTGIWLARRFTRRIFALLSGTRQVAAGELTARVELAGRDELAELAGAFNRMVEDLARDREKIAYLQRVSTWQDVARKLAHEIKNPLTPIQLAVQQCVSSYRGDDERYRRLLGDTEEIVTEEIAGLRRLVDAFRTLGQLPRVDAKPIELGAVVDDLRKDPMLVDHLDIAPPAEPVMIRGDRMLLRRVLSNLVENGVHAAEGAGRTAQVRICWHSVDYSAKYIDAQSGRVRITVDDSGPGVPEDRRDTLFEPYITHKEQGTGLGLTIAKKIAIEHGGTLELSRDRAELGGARFVLTLPLAGDQPPVR